MRVNTIVPERIALRSSHHCHFIFISFLLFSLSINQIRSGLLLLLIKILYYFIIIKYNYYYYYKMSCVCVCGDLMFVLTEFLNPIDNRYT